MFKEYIKVKRSVTTDHQKVQWEFVGRGGGSQL